jgi:hypothetical protein
MTWIVGSAGILNPFIAGDVRVTFRGEDGRAQERDCLQKIYPVTRNILAGFAGSVALGIDVLSAITERVDLEHWFSLPELAYTWFPRLMRWRFGLAAERERKLGCQVLMIGTHPWLPMGELPIPDTDVFRFLSPRFEPERAKGQSCLGIGCGNYVEELRAVAERNAMSDAVCQANTAGPAAVASTMAFMLHRALQRRPTPGISEWFVYGTLSLDGIILEPFKYELPTSTPVVHRSPPWLARGEGEFLAYARKNGLIAQAASAA